MTTQRIDELRDELNEYFDDGVEGMTIEAAFNEIESCYPEAVVYWGCYSKSDLEIIL